LKLELGLDVLRSYKRLPYTSWHALAEFVDNSTQSYFNNREKLDAAYLAEGDSLSVSLIYEKDGDGLIRIADNAMGMDYEELNHALHIGLPPENTTGRSRYGLGMKMAACWYGEYWSIVTKKLGGTVEYTVRIDVERVASGDDDLVVSEVTDLDPSLHYTRIEITHLNHRPHGRSTGKLKTFLTGIYRIDLESGTMRLSWQGTPLEWVPDWQFLKDAQGNEYRKSIDIEVNGKRIWGWVGVLDTGGRSKSGFAIVHNDRMVRTWPDAWYPERIFGTSEGSNTLVSQRLLGELHLDQFDIGHTKDDIHWVDDEEDEVQDKLLEECSEYRSVAQSARKRPKVDSVAIQAAARAMEAELRSTEMMDLIDEEPPPVEVIDEDTQTLIEETDTSSCDFSADLSYRGHQVKVLGILDTTKSANDPYVLCEASQPDRVLVIINMNHPHLAEIDDNGLLNYFKHCTYDALAEWKARNQASTVDPATIRRLKDQLLRVGIEIELHSEEHE
jgi:hypothetical protein